MKANAWIVTVVDDNDGVVTVDNKLFETYRESIEFLNKDFTYFLESDDDDWSEYRNVSFFNLMEGDKEDVIISSGSHKRIFTLKPLKISLNF